MINLYQDLMYINEFLVFEAWIISFIYRLVHGNMINTPVVFSNMFS
jgi:hypothetical protein